MYGGAGSYDAFATHGTSSHGEAEQLEFLFLITNADDYEKIDLLATTHGVQEIAAYGFVDPVSENVLPVILQDAAFYVGLEQSDEVQFYAALT